MVVIKKSRDLKFNAEKDTESICVDGLIGSFTSDVVIVDGPEIVLERENHGTVSQAQTHLLMKDIESVIGILIAFEIIPFSIVDGKVRIDFIGDVDHEAIDRVESEQRADFLSQVVVVVFPAVGIGADVGRVKPDIQEGHINTGAEVFVGEGRPKINEVSQV